MAPCSLVDAHGFGGIYCLRFQGSSMASDPSKQPSRLHNPLQAAVCTALTQTSNLQHFVTWNFQEWMKINAFIKEYLCQELHQLVAPVTPARFL